MRTLLERERDQRRLIRRLVQLIQLDVSDAASCLMDHKKLALPRIYE